MASEKRLREIGEEIENITEGNVVEVNPEDQTIVLEALVPQAEMFHDDILEAEEELPVEFVDDYYYTEPKSKSQIEAERADYGYVPGGRQQEIQQVTFEYTGREPAKEVHIESEDIEADTVVLKKNKARRALNLLRKHDYLGRKVASWAGQHLEDLDLHKVDKVEIEHINDKKVMVRYGTQYRNLGHIILYDKLGDAYSQLLFKLAELDVIPKWVINKVGKAMH